MRKTTLVFLDFLLTAHIMCGGLLRCYTYMDNDMKYDNLHLQKSKKG